jgi:hypothetical protein
MRFVSLLLTCTVLGTLSIGAKAQTTLDFENLANPSNGADTDQGHSVTQNGFTVTDTSNLFDLHSVAPNNGIGLNYTGSVALFNNTSSGTTTLTQNNGNTFTLNSIDIANFSLQSSGVTVVFTGNVQGGGTVTQTFTHGTNDALETVTFGSDFTNLLSVSFGQDPPFNQFDNIRINFSSSAVPEPGSIALLAGMGLSGAGFLARRRKNARQAV